MSLHAGRSLTRSRTAVAAVACAATFGLAGCGSSGGSAASPNGSGASTGTTGSRGPSKCSSTSAANFTGTPLPFGTAAPTGSSSALEISAGRPRVSSVPSGRDGYRLVQVPVKAAVRTNGTFAIDHGQFELVDRAGHSCKQPSINPLAGGFVALTVDEAKSGSGYVAFLVPKSVASNLLMVRYLPATGADSASLAWRADAKTPAPSRSTDSCDGEKSALKTSGADKGSFGKTIRHGDDVVSMSVRAGTPHRRAFDPGPTQPNNVDAIDVKLRVSADGADAYVDRRSFALVDGSGRLCRSSDTSAGQTLTSALVKKGHSKDYTIVFWVPKDSAIHGLKLLQLTKPGGSKAESVWSDPKLTLKPLT